MSLFRNHGGVPKTLVADKPFVAGQLDRALKEEQIHAYVETHACDWSVMCHLSTPTEEKLDIDWNLYLSSSQPKSSPLP